MLFSHSCYFSRFFFFFNDPATTEIYTLSLHDALPISDLLGVPRPWRERLFHGQLPLDRAAEWRLADALRLCARGDERQTGEEPAATLAHAAHLAPRSRSAGSLGGLPRSQKTSRSIVSS